MNPLVVGSIIAGYFILLISISWITSRKSKADDFYTANRQSPWYLVAFGMIGASLSGVTFISVPGEVANSNFYYFQVVLGYLVGYWVIAKILLPIYYQLNLVSIYTYLEQRFGYWSYKTGAFFFILSRIVGASFRLFLVASVLQIAFFDAFNLPFWVSVLASVLLIWIYTFRGGIKTIVWTDTLQTSFMLLSAIVTIIFIANQLDWSIGDLISHLSNDPRSQIFNWEWSPGTNFFKQFFSGAFIAIVMTGLDQDMMQKNLTCKTLSDAQKNIFWFCVVLVIVNIMFLSLGLLLYQFAEIKSIAIPLRTDGLYPFLAVNHFSFYVAIVFMLGITAAAYSSADSALTALTTSICVDFLGFTKENYSARKKTRMGIHFGLSIILFMVILLFESINDASVITSIFKAAGYTYGPLLGLFSLGIATKVKLKDPLVPWVCLASPVLSYIININSKELLWGYQFGFEILILNGLITFGGLILIKK